MLKSSLFWMFGLAITAGQLALRWTSSSYPMIPYPTSMIQYSKIIPKMPLFIIQTVFACVVVLQCGPIFNFLVNLEMLALLLDSGLMSKFFAGLRLHLNGQSYTILLMMNSAFMGEKIWSIFKKQGWAPRSFPFRTFRSFSFKKENVTFFSVLFSRFWRLIKPKRTLRSFPFFSKERKRTERT